VKIPLMPKGVEHKSESLTIREMLAVKIPLMPKGVEHQIGNYTLKAGSAG